MSRKNSILIIVAVTLLIVGGLVFWFLNSNQGGNNATSTAQTTNPFGNTGENKPSTTTTQIPPENIPSNQQQTQARLVQIYKNPSAGAVFTTNTNKQTVLRFLDRAVGNVYEYMPVSQTGEAQRITNTTIPKIQESFWSNSGNNLVLRYLNDDTDNISSFSAKIILSSSTINLLGELVGNFLSSNIKQIAINPAGDRIFSIMDKSDRSGIYGYTTLLDGSSKKLILTSPISYWNVSWPKDNVITLTTKANYKDTGLMYFFNPQTSSMDRILGNITGLSTVTNKNANLVAYSYSTGNSFLLDAYDVTNRVNISIKAPTLAEKCVWGNNNAKVLYCAIPQTVASDNYPDAWYQGIESFSDNIWKIDTELGTTEEIYEIGSNENATIDATNLIISADDKYLSFSNKNDLSLWILNTEPIF